MKPRQSKVIENCGSQKSAHEAHCGFRNLPEQEAHIHSRCWRIGFLCCAIYALPLRSIYRILAGIEVPYVYQELEISY